MDAAFERERRPFAVESLFEREVAHEVGFHAAQDAEVVARHGVTFAVPVPFVGQLPPPPLDARREGRRIDGNVDELFADRFVGRAERIAPVDRTGPCEIAVEEQSPAARSLGFGREFGFDAVTVDAADVDRGVDTQFGTAYPEYPVVDARIEHRGRRAQRTGVAFERRFQARVERPAPFGFEVLVAAGTEVEVVERGVAVVAGGRSPDDHAAAFREHVVREQRRDDGRGTVSV